MSASIEVKGLREVEEKLKRLSAATGQKVLASAGRKAFSPVLETAKALVPVGTEGPPHLRDALALTVRTKGLQGDTAAVVGLRIKKLPPKVRKFLKAMKKRYGIALAHSNPRRYWHLVEFGTSRSRAAPFLRPAFNQNVTRVIEGARQELKKKVDAAVRKVGP